MRPADKLQVEAAKFLPLVGRARYKQDPLQRGHGAQYLYHPPPAGAKALHGSQRGRCIGEMQT